MLKLAILSMLLVFLSFSSGCANKAKPVEFPEGASPSVEMGRLETDIQQAELDQVDITAPDYFSVAKRKLAEARKMESEGKPEHKILKTVGEARGNLNYAIVTQQDFRGELNDILEAREMALKAGALENYPSEFSRVDWDLKEAVKGYKPNKEFLSFSTHQQFKNKYYDLQKRAIAANDKVERTIAVEELNFDPAEADVYRDGEKILIRLKGETFAPGQAEISEGAHPTLDKVKEILSSMDAEQVKVEGFTDSTGSAAVNQKLSEQRAESVADYLLAPDGAPLTTSEIEYQGLGAKKPVTSNLTTEGRAANRRVDIIITPTKVE